MGDGRSTPATLRRRGVKRPLCSSVGEPSEGAWNGAGGERYSCTLSCSQGRSHSRELNRCGAPIILPQNNGIFYFWQVGQK